MVFNKIRTTNNKKNIIAVQYSLISIIKNHSSER